MTSEVHRSEDRPARPVYRAVAVACIAAALVASNGVSAAATQRGVNPTNAGRPDAVLVWNENMVKAANAACIGSGNHPLLEARLYAMAHVAIHDALNAIDRRARPYIAGLPRQSGASPQAAVAAAAHGVLVAELDAIPPPFPPECSVNGVASADADYTAALAAIADGQAKTLGIQLGQAAAAAIVARRTGDGSATQVTDDTYPEGTSPGEYRFTPGTPFVFAPRWGEVHPFVLADAAQFRPGPPPSLTSSRYTRDFKEVKRLGGDGSVNAPSERTAEQTQIALFWVENSPAQWNRITRTVSGAKGVDLWANARLFALLNLAMADGYIGTFETKYHYNFWRPVTAIQLADTDGNPDTVANPNWLPLVGTPPIPDYDSGHSVEGGTAAQVLKRFFGTDRATFKVCSMTLPDGERCGQPSEVLRRYTSFTQAADENGLSRILVGFHFRTAVEQGITHGRKIGDRAVDRFLQEV